jgi:hypothetical protein
MESMSFHVIPDGFHPFHMEYVLGEISPKLVFLFHAYSTCNRWNPPGIHGIHLESMESTWNPWNPPGIHGIHMEYPHGIHMEYSTSIPWIPDGFHLIPWIPGRFLTGKHNNNRNNNLNH